MNLSGVEFPQSIIDAIDNHKLVVFAGAGVSVGEPSCLPRFRELAKDLAAGTSLRPKEFGTDSDGYTIYEPLDQFLGRLPGKQSSLRNNAAKFTNLGTAHNELHESLVRVFKNPSDVRIVTTNYDLMFESAAASLWSDTPEVYSAPALPMGKNFRGVVHVHGSISRPSGIVLTDGDFGRAYLTEGWARRFLVDAFTGDNVILFVGYRYEDTVLQYLTKALPDRSERHRYALVKHDDNEEKWRLLGVDPVVFTQEDQKDYTALYCASKALADYATRTPSEWQDKIGSIAKNPPASTDIQDEDVIRSALKTESHTRFFGQAAKHAEWVPWLIREGAFISLFEGDSPEQHANELANWLINSFLRERTDSVIQVLASDRRPVRHWFWWKLALETKVIDNSPGFGQIFDYLLQSKPWNVDVHALQVLGEQCAKLGDEERLLLVFRQMAQMHISLNKPYSFGDESRTYRYEIETASPHWNLDEIWNLLAGYIDTQGEAILHVCEEIILGRKIVGDSWQRIGSHWDLDSDRRSSIDPHEQDNYPQAIDVVINAAREALAFLGKSVPAYTVHWLHSRSNSNSHLIRRLAVYAIGQLVTFGPGERIRLLISKGLFDGIHRQESFMLLMQEFPLADEETKAEAIGAILNYRDESAEDIEKSSSQVHFDWLLALQESAPESGVFVFSNDALLTTIGVLSIKVDYGTYLGAVFIFSIAVIASSIFQAMRARTTVLIMYLHKQFNQRNLQQDDSR